jgi:regulator of protease activity HflC (stomatin/prohibitin superfamily)
MKKFLKICFVVLMMSMFAACGRIDTGHTGVRTNWDKTVDPQVVTPGPYLSITSEVQQYVTNEVTFKIEGAHPQTADKSYLKDLDLTYIYKITSNDLPSLVTNFKNRTLIDEKTDDYYPMGLYVDTIMRASLSTAVGEFNAMDANLNRSKIESETIRIASEKFKQEGLADVIHVSQATVTNVEVDPKLQEAVVRQLNAQTDNKTKDIEIDTANKETKRIEALQAAGSSAANAGYIALLNAQANMKIAEGIANGRVNTIVVPTDFKGIVNTAK